METLSVSRVQTYLGCPLRFRFRYVDQIPSPWKPAALAFGTSVHAALEWFHKERQQGHTPDSDAIVAVFEADWQAQTISTLVYGERDSQEGFREKGMKLLELYAQQTNPTPPDAVEERFEVDLVDPESGEVFGIRLIGIIDLIEGDTIIDFKTAARTLSTGDLERHLQLSTYALASFLKTGQIPRLRLDLLLKTRTPRIERQETTRTISDLAWAAHLIQGVSRQIVSERFFPSPSWRCTECEYFPHCQAWRGNGSPF